MNTKLDATQKKEEMKNLAKTATAEKPKTDQQQSATLPKIEKEDREIISLLNPTPQQRILAAKNFKLVSDRYDHLKEKQDQLNAFRLSSDGTQEKFKLSNNAGFIFEFTATDVIEDVIDVVEKHLNRRIADVSEEILKFTI